MTRDEVLLLPAWPIVTDGLPGSLQRLTHGEALLGPLQLADLVIHLTVQRDAVTLDHTGVGGTHPKSLLLTPRCNVNTHRTCWCLLFVQVLIADGEACRWNTYQRAISSNLRCWRTSTTAHTRQIWIRSAQICSYRVTQKTGLYF